jgi:hypothetical protein
MLLQLAYLGITNAFALLRLLPGRDKDAEILALRLKGASSASRGVTRNDVGQS